MARIPDAVVPEEDPQTAGWLSMRPRRDVGYDGQRYEVRAMRPQYDVPGGARKHEEFVVGWTNQDDGGRLAKMVSLHPTWHSARVYDLGEEEFERRPTERLVR